MSIDETNELSIDRLKFWYFDELKTNDNTLWICVVKMNLILSVNSTFEKLQKYI